MLKMISKKALLSLVFTFQATASYAVSTSFNGDAEINNRYFFESPAFAGQHSNKLNTAISADLEYEFDFSDDINNGNDLLLTLNPRMRYDFNDKERNLLDLTEAKLDYQTNDFQFVLGNDKIFWGVVESRHLVDIINQDDALEDIDGEEKLGQPMLSATYFGGSIGTMSIYYMPYFRARDFAGTKGRLRPFIPINGSDTYEDGINKYTPSFAARYSNVLGDIDFGISHFSGIGREPVFTLDQNNNIAPKYSYIEQSGLDAQYTNDGVLLKLEAINRTGQGSRFFAVSGGLEYSFYNVDNNDTDIGILSEYHIDKRDKDITKAPFTIYNNDIFLGTRISLNDIEGTTFLGGAMIDLDTQNTFYTAEFSRRLGDIIGEEFKLEVDARIYQIKDNNSFESNFANDNHVTAKLKTFF